MNASADLSIITLVMNASIVVKCVLGLLIFASLASWATIFSKAIVLSRSLRETNDFEKRFWSGADLAKLYETAVSRHDRTCAEERIFAAGMTEYLKLSGRPQVELLSGVRRAMTAVFQREVDDLERGLPLLASIGSVSPYIGLFGTVWGMQPQSAFSRPFPQRRHTTSLPTALNASPAALTASPRNTSTSSPGSTRRHAQSRSLQTWHLEAWPARSAG